MKPVAPTPAASPPPDQPGGEGASFYFRRAAGATFINAPDDPPHRHTYQELMLVEEGLVRHGVDGQHYEVGSHTLVLVPRGRVHTMDRAVELTGWLLQFSDDFLPAGRAGEAWPDPVAALGGFGLAPALALRPDDLRALNAVADLIA